MTKASLTFRAGPVSRRKLALPAALGCELCWALARGGAYDFVRRWELRWDTPVDYFDARIAQVEANITLRGLNDLERRELDEAIRELVGLRRAAAVQQSAQPE